MFASFGHALRRRCRWRVLVVSIVACAGSVACSPEYDWRRIEGPDGRFQVQLPAKPSNASRHIVVDGHPVLMQIQGARVGMTAFTVGWIDWPDASLAVQGSRAMREQMLRNIGAPPDAPSHDVAVRLDAPGREVRAGTTPAIEVDAQGVDHKGEVMRLRGRFLHRGTSSYQVVVLGPSVDDEQARNFLDGFVLRERGAG